MWIAAVAATIAALLISMSHGAYRDIVPGPRFLVMFGDDMGYVHERVAMWPLTSAIVGGPAQSYAIITPGGDAYEETVSDYSGLRLMDNAAPIYPADFVEDNEVVQFEVPMSDKTLLGEINAARRSAAAIIGTRPQAKPATRYLTRSGGEKDVPPLGIGARTFDALSSQRTLERPVRGAGEAGDAPVRRLQVKSRPAGAAGSRKWVIAEPGWSKDVGAVVSDAHGALPDGSLVGHDRGLALIGDEYVPVAEVDAGTERRHSRRNCRLCG